MNYATTLKSVLPYASAHGSRLFSMQLFPATSPDIAVNKQNTKLITEKNDDKELNEILSFRITSKFHLHNYPFEGSVASKYKICQKMNQRANKVLKPSHN